MNLYLVRHGQATSKAENPERPLTDEGRETVGVVGAALAGRAAPTEIRHSTKLRARQTAEVLAARLGAGDLLSEDETLGPTDDVTLIAAELVDRSDDLMLVGHLPYVDRLASHLVTGDADREAFDFAAGGAMCLSREDESGRGPWVVRWLIDPSLLQPR